MQPAVPTPRNGRNPGRERADRAISAISTRSDAPPEHSARNNGPMSQQPSSEVPVQPAAQPSVGSLAAHRPHAVATSSSGSAALSTAADLDPEIDADADAYEPDVDGDELPQGRFLDRERSWLAFNERVLELAEDPSTPLLERANFLAIFASNLDEFFMVRVAGLKRRIATGVATRSASGLQPREVLDLIWTRSRELMARHAACYQQDVAPALSDEGIQLIRWPELNEKEQARLFTFFRQRVFPVLTPSPSTRRTPSRTSPASRSTWPSSYATRSAATATSPGSRCRRC